MHKILKKSLPGKVKNIQPKFTVGGPDYQYEQAAGRLVGQVIRIPNGEGPLQRKCEECKEETFQMQPLAAGIRPVVQKRTEDEDQERVQTKQAVGDITTSPSLESRLNNKKGQGQPLSKTTQQSMSRTFGADFSGVRVHTDQDAVQMNGELGAKAFTHGGDVYFRLS